MDWMKDALGALALGTHPRLGSDSAVGCLNPGIMEQVKGIIEHHMDQPKVMFQFNSEIKVWELGPENVLRDFRRHFGKKEYLRYWVNKWVVVNGPGGSVWVHDYFGHTQPICLLHTEQIEIDEDGEDEELLHTVKHVDQMGFLHIGYLPKEDGPLGKHRGVWEIYDLKYTNGIPLVKRVIIDGPDIPGVDNYWLAFLGKYQNSDTLVGYFFDRHTEETYSVIFNHKTGTYTMDPPVMSVTSKVPISGTPYHLGKNYRKNPVLDENDTKIATFESESYVEEGCVAYGRTLGGHQYIVTDISSRGRPHFHTFTMYDFDTDVRDVDPLPELGELGVNVNSFQRHIRQEVQMNWCPHICI